MRPYLRVANVYEDRIDLRDVMEMHFEEREVERYELKPGDILLNEGQSRELVGRPAMYRGELPGACFTNSLVRFQASEIVDKKYALELFRHWLKSGFFQKIAQITTNIAHLGAGRFADLDFPLPPLNEQRRIVAKLEALQARSHRVREALDAVPPLLEKLRQSILAAAFRGDLTKDWRAKHKDVEPASELLKRIRTERRKKWEEAELAKMKAKGKAPTDDKWKAKYKEPEPVDATGLPELPEGWCWASVDALLPTPEDLFDGPFGSALKSSDYTSSGVRVVRLENVANLEFRGDKETFVSPTKYESLARHSVRAGDIIFGSFVEEATRVCMLPELGGPAIAKADCFCVRPDAQVIRAQLMVFALGSHHARTELTRGIHGATRPRINTGQLRSLRVALPPRDEQPIILDPNQARSGSVRGNFS
jgi:type I restriction enzyme S subunit